MKLRYRFMLVLEGDGKDPAEAFANATKSRKINIEGMDGDVEYEVIGYSVNLNQQDQPKRT
tara:strand:- start:358 stop:540 length:183 start_codon:yes stop_codon:yes gene_type:complete